MARLNSKERRWLRVYESWAEDRGVPLGQRLVIRVGQSIADGSITRSLLAILQLFKKAKVSRN